MTHTFLVPRLLIIAAAVWTAGCTMKDQPAPPISGPSEFGTSISIAIAPDILPQDGASQSVITVTARGPNGRTLPNVPLRAEILVGGTPADFGVLSARSLTTGADGRGVLVYTAPLSAPVAVDTHTIVDIAVTPIGTDYGNSAARTASLRLVPRGVVVPPDGLRPAFTLSPTAPLANQTVLFDASGSQAPANNPIAAWRWDFGDGRTAAGRTASHQFGSPGSYIVTLTITDGLGRSASTSQNVTVNPGASPVAQFVFSPAAPAVNQQVNFNAAASTPAPGRGIASYTWDFGDGTPAGSGSQAAHTYTKAGAYSVTLTVTDDAGRRGTVSKEVAVGP